MAKTTVPIELSSTPSIVDNGTATAITIDSSQNVDVAGTITADREAIYSGVLSEQSQIRFGYSSDYHWSMGRENATTGDLFIESSTTGTDTTRLKIGNNGDISFYEDTGTTAKLFWDASAESLGIGTSSPYSNVTIIPSSNPTSVGTATQLSVGESSANSGYALKMGYFVDGGGYKSSIQSIAGSSGAVLVLNGDGGNVGIGTSSPTAGGGLTLSSSTTAQGFIDFKNTVDSDSGYIGNAKALINGATTAQLGVRGGTNGIAFSVVATEAMRIDSSGNLLVGRTSSGSTGNGHTIRGGDSAIFSRDAAGESMQVCRNASAGDLVRFYCNGVDKGSIDFDGSNTISYTSSSDQRLKENIVDAPSASDDIDAIQVRSFDWKADGSHQKYGMVAQELQTVAPEAVSGDADSDEMMGVDYSKLVPMLVKEIQSLRARVAQLEN